MSATPNLALPLLAAAQAQKHVTHNEALMILDGLINCAVIDRDLAAPPASPVENAAYIIAAAPTGAWAGRAGQIARFRDGGWVYATPADGWLCWVDDEQALLVFNGTAWGAPPVFQNLSLIGVAATADATTRLSVAAAQSQFSHAGAGHQLRINKSGTLANASVLLMSNLSGRAEIGTLGDDKLRIRVSSNGSAWTDGLTLDPATGNAGIGTTAPSTRLHVNGPARVAGYVKAGLPSAATAGAGSMIYVTDDVGGPTIAFSDGAAWRRVHDRAIIA